MTTITRAVADMINSTNFSNNQPTIFDYMAVPVEKALKSLNDSYLVVLMNHREKIFFVGQTASISIYMGNVSRFFRSHEGSVFAGIPTGALPTSQRGAHKYWSAEIIPATRDNWEHMHAVMRGKSFVVQSTRGFLPPPSAMNICRITHTATGWSRFFSEETTEVRSITASRRIGFQHGVEFAIRSHIMQRLIKDPVLVTAYQTLGSQLCLGIQTNTGVTIEVVNTFNGRSEIATVDMMVRNLNVQATRNFEKFLGIINPRDYIGSKTSTVRAEPVRFHKPGTVASKPVLAIPPEAMVTSKPIAVPAPPAPTPASTISLSLEDIESKTLQWMSREHHNDCEYILNKCEKHQLDVDDVCGAFAEVLKHSGIWSKYFNSPTKDQIKSALYTNQPPEGLGFAGFFPIFITTVNSIVNEIVEAAEVD